MSPEKSVPNWGQNEPIAYQRDNEPSEIVIPKTEGVAREVGKAPKELQPEVWKEIVERFGDDPTAKQVKEVVADFSSDNYPDKQSTVGASCRDKTDICGAFAPSSAKQTLEASPPAYAGDPRTRVLPLITGNQKLVKQFEIGQLVKLQLTNFDGVDDDLRLANHSYGIVEDVTESLSSLRISILENGKSFVVLPQDIKVIKSVDISVNFTAEKFIALMSVYKSKAGIESALKKGVLGN